MKTARPHSTDPCTTVLAPAGELDLAVLPELRLLLLPAVRPGAAVVLDLRDVTFMDSSALAVVLTADRRLRATGGSLQLVNVAPQVHQVLRICGLGERLIARPERPVDTALPPAWTVFTRDRG